MLKRVFLRNISKDQITSCRRYQRALFQTFLFSSNILVDSWSLKLIMMNGINHFTCNHIMFQKVELSSPKIEKILIFSQKKVFLISREMEFSRLELKKLPYIFGGNFPCSEIFFSAFKERSWHGLQINDLRKYFRRFFSEFGSWKCHLILRCFFLKVIDSHGFGGEILYLTRHCRLFYYRVCKVYALVNHEISYEYSAEDLKTMLLKFPNFPIFWKPDK